MVYHNNDTVLKTLVDPKSEELTCREKVIQALVDIPQGEILAEALNAQHSFVHWVTADQIAGITEINVSAGHGPQNLDFNPVNTEFDAYLKTVIQPQIRDGLLMDGSQADTFDDRKVRWSGAGTAGFWQCQDKTLTLEVGPTSYPRCCMDIRRDPLAALKLMLRGLKDYQDPYAYFARGMGVVVVPITTDGHVYIGRRSPNLAYQNSLNFVAGWATFSEKRENINFYQDAQRELQEETHIDMVLNNSNTQLVGISGNPLTGEADLVFVVQTNVPDQHFQKGQWPEHLNWIGLHRQTEAEALLEKGFLPGQSQKESNNLMFSSRLGLEYLVNSHW